MRFLLNLPAPGGCHGRQIGPVRGRQISPLDDRTRHGRSFAAAARWRANGTIDTFISFFITRKPSLAGMPAAVEIVTNIMIYHLHGQVGAASKTVLATATEKARISAPMVFAT